MSTLLNVIKALLKILLVKIVHPKIFSKTNKFQNKFIPKNNRIKRVIIAVKA